MQMLEKQKEEAAAEKEEQAYGLLWLLLYSS